MPLSLPHRVLLAVLRAQPDAEYPLRLAPELDAPGRAALLRQLRSQGLSGWAWRVFKDAGLALPSDLAGPLTSDHAANTARSILALAAYERISQILSEAGVEHIPLKGIRLLETLYPDPGTRHLSDIDVLVRKVDVDRADAALRKAGFRGEDLAMWTRQARFHHHHGYEASGAFAGRLELHWRLSSSFALGESTERLWDGARLSENGAVSAFERDLDPEIRLHSMLLHAAGHAYHIAQEWILDFRRLLERPEAGALTAALVARVERLRTRSPCFFVLQLVARVAGSAAAAELASRIRPMAIRARALELLASPEWFFERGEFLRGKWANYGMLVGLSDRPTDQVRAALGSVFYKADVEGIVVPGFVDRLFGE